MTILTRLIRIFTKRAAPPSRQPAGLDGPHRKTALKVLAIGMVATKHSGGLS